MNKKNEAFIVTYKFLRRSIGVIGIALPFVPVFGNALIYHQNLQPSISDYYYTDMRNVLVGSLCAIGMFLPAYRCENKIDSVLGTLACFFALEVAFFPTSPEVDQLPARVNLPATMIGYFHIFFAGALFITLASFSLFLFTRTKPNKEPTPQKKMRMLFTMPAEIIILLAILGIASALVQKSRAITIRLTGSKPSPFSSLASLG